MALINHSYFGSTLPLIVAGNEPAIDEACQNYESDYFRAALGTSLYAAMEAGRAAKKGVYFSTQFTNQFFKGGIDIRWGWIISGNTFTYCGRSYYWPGVQNPQKRSPLANYVYWKYLDETNPRPTSVGGFADTALENATVASVKKPMIKAWNEMVDWHSILYKMLRSFDPVTGLPWFPEFNGLELCEPESINVYHHQLPA